MKSERLIQDILSKLFSQFRNLFMFYVKLYLPLIAILLLLVLINIKIGISLSYFMRDPIQIMDGKFYYGIISNLGVIFWCCCAAICFFSSCLVKEKTNSRELAIFLKWSGIITTILLLDDFFLFHDVINHEYFHIKEKFIVAGYGLLILYYLIRFTSFILKTEFSILFLAFMFFGLSVVFDYLIGSDNTSFLYIFEDGFKLLAIVSWFAYFTRLSYQSLKSLYIDKTV